MKRSLVFFLAVFYCVSAFPQQKQLKSYIIDDIVYEKLYLHIDREMYVPGETIWFKVYLLSGIDHTLIKGHKNVYVQLINSSNEVVDDRLVLTLDGSAQGDFSIPRDLADGYYTIRANTRYQENFGEESYFYKKIWISGISENNRGTGYDHFNKFEIGFYPESGNMIVNAPNTVAFRAVDSTGHGISLSGHVVNDLGDTITPFVTEFLGLGSFKFMPREGRKYYAVLDDKPEYRHEFTSISKQGATLHFAENDLEVLFAIITDFKGNTNGTYRLKVSHKGLELFEETVEVASFYHEIALPKTDFPLGISKITLLGNDGLVLAERLIFVKSGSLENITITPDSLKYHNRSKVQLTLKSQLNESDAVTDGLSISVINRQYMNGDGYDSDILSYLLLDSELKGPIESPSSFFKDDRISSGEKLNLLMMVHGWRSYYWNEIIPILNTDPGGWDDIGLTVSGMVKRFFRNQLIGGAEVTLGPLSPGFMYHDTLTDEQGRFSFDHLFLYDTSMLLIEARNKRGGRFTEILLDSMYVPPAYIFNDSVMTNIPDPIVPRRYYSASFSMLEAERKYAIESGNLWLEEVEIVNERPASFYDLSKREFGAWLGDPDRTYEMGTDRWKYVDLYDFFESNQMGVIVNGESLIIRGQPAAIYLDGMPLPYPVENIVMADVEYIDILTNAIALAAIGDFNVGGLISIYTNYGEKGSRKKYVKGRLTKIVDGFQIPNRFFSPNYTIDNIYDLNPDYRPTLYWNPFVKMSDGIGNVEFFTSDFHSDYIIIVEGISEHGRICKGMGRFSVGR